MTAPANISVNLYNVIRLLYEACNETDTLEYLDEIVCQAGLAMYCNCGQIVFIQELKTESTTTHTTFYKCPMCELTYTANPQILSYLRGHISNLPPVSSVTITPIPEHVVNESFPFIDSSEDDQLESGPWT